MADSQNDLAKIFRCLHIAGDPVVLTNVWDVLSAEEIVKLPVTKALATASFGVARTVGMKDQELTLEANLDVVKRISKVATEARKPLTVDAQDGYGEQLENFVAEIITAGAVGMNLEDYDKENERFYSIEEATDRIKRAMDVARSNGVPDFVVNARCDTLVYGGALSETIQRGKAYLAAGACTCFVWGGGKRGTSRNEIEELTQAFEGKLNVSMRISGDTLSLEDLKKIGVSRISVGPQLQLSTMSYLASLAEKVARGAKV